MSFKEVTNLRKSGQLDEAIRMAIEDLEANCDDWTLSALFWCFNDLYKNQSGSLKEQTVARMGELVQQMAEGNDVALKCLERAQASISPHFSTIRDAVEQSKQGEAYKSYEEISQIYDEGSLPTSNYEDYGWVIYRALHQNHKLDVVRQKKILIRYFDLKLPRPSLLHSMILTIAVNIEKETPLQLHFFSFLEKWDLKNLREEDWEGGEVKDGMRYPSLVEKVITVGMKELMSSPSVTPSEDFLMVLEKAVKRWPENTNIIRYKAQVCRMNHNLDESLRLYKEAIIQTPDRYYLWSELAEIVDDLDLCIALLCKALSITVPPEFLGKIRVTLANLLIDKQMYGWAVGELEKVKELYNKQGWKLPSSYMDAFGRIPAERREDSSPQKYAEYVPMAETYVFSDLPSSLMVKIREQVDNQRNRNNGKVKPVVKWTLVDKYGTKLKLKPKSYGLPTKMPNGQCFDVKMSGKHLVLIKPLDDIPNVEWIREVHGEVRIKNNREGKCFGFVGNCFIHNNLLNGIGDRTDVNGVAICQDGKWQLVRLC